MRTTITIRLDEQTRTALDSYSRSTGLSISDVIREQLDTALGRGLPETRNQDPKTLSVEQRTNMILQHTILRRLSDEDSHEAKHHDMAIEILSEGYTGEYHRLFAGVFPELPAHQCKLFFDILSMFLNLRNSVNHLAPEDRTELNTRDLDALTFAGFDGNDELEGRFLSYLDFQQSNGRWQVINDQKEYPENNWDSHAVMLPTYRRMLEKTKAIDDQHRSDQTRSYSDRWFSAKELKEVALAAR